MVTGKKKLLRKIGSILGENRFRQQRGNFFKFLIYFLPPEGEVPRCRQTCAPNPRPLVLRLRLGLCDLGIHTEVENPRRNRDSGKVRVS